MSLMFAKQFSEAGVSTNTGKKGGRGKAGSGLMSKSKRGGRSNQEDVGDSTGGLFNMDANAAYRTHMLFPGRKEEEGAGPGGGDPRRSSGSPGFMKAMMSWGGGKRGSEGRVGAGQELQRYSHGSPGHNPDSECSPLDPLYGKSVSFHFGSGSHQLAAASNYPNPAEQPHQPAHFPSDDEGGRNLYLTLLTLYIYTAVISTLFYLVQVLFRKCLVNHKITYAPAQLM